MTAQRNHWLNATTTDGVYTTVGTARTLAYRVPMPCKYTTQGSTVIYMKNDMNKGVHRIIIQKTQCSEGIVTHTEESCHLHLTADPFHVGFPHHKSYILFRYKFVYYG